MTTLLSVCQEVNRLVGLQGYILSVNNVSGYQATLVGYVKNAYTDIQNLRDNWEFLLTEENITVTSATNHYTLTGDVSSFKNIYYNKTPLSYISYEQYVIDDVENQVSSKPCLFTIVPYSLGESTFYINPVDSSYILNVFYYKKAMDISGDTDIIQLPEEFTKLVSYRAAADFAGFIGNGNLYQLYTQKADTLLGKLLRLQNISKKINIRGRTI